MSTNMKSAPKHPEQPAITANHKGLRTKQAHNSSVFSCFFKPSSIKSSNNPKKEIILTTCVEAAFDVVCSLIVSGKYSALSERFQRRRIRGCIRRIRHNQPTPRFNAKIRMGRGVRFVAGIALRSAKQHCPFASFQEKMLHGGENSGFAIQKNRIHFRRIPVVNDNRDFVARQKMESGLVATSIDDHTRDTRGDKGANRIGTLVVRTPATCQTL